MITSTTGPKRCGADHSLRRILVITNTFPSRANGPIPREAGVFVKNRVRAVADLPGYQVRVIAPVPYFPPVKSFSRWYAWSRYPHEEIVDGLQVYRPRYFLPPKVGAYFHPQLMYRAVRKSIDRLKNEYDFDLIDAHWIYPNGVLAAMLGRRYNKPVMMTGRGDDARSYPHLPFKGKTIRWALRQDVHVVAVSREIGHCVERLGVAPDRISVIPNGVDTESFRVLPQKECRRRLGLPENGKIILSIGNRRILKGFDILVDSLPSVLRRHADARVVIVGGPGYADDDNTGKIKQRIKAHAACDRVTLAGARPHHELPLWYNSADVFALLSSREGSSNVVLESLACGVPVVATPVGGIVEELTDTQYGYLLPQRTAKAAALFIARALSRCWDRDAIRKASEGRSWKATADAIRPLLQSALGEK